MEVVILPIMHNAGYAPEAGLFKMGMEVGAAATAPNCEPIPHADEEQEAGPVADHGHHIVSADPDPGVTEVSLLA